MTKRSTTIDDLLAIETPSDPQLSPDGQFLAFTVRHVDTKKNRNVTRIFVGPTDGSTKPRAFTSGDDSCGQPRFSHDSTTLFFTSARIGKKSQIFAISTDGGEATRLTDLPHGSIGLVVPHPDNRRVVFSFRPTDPERTEDAADARKKAFESTPPRVISRARFRQETVGFLPSARYSLMVLDTQDNSVTTLDPHGALPTDRDLGEFVLFPDGRRIAFVANIAPDPDRRISANGLFVWEIGSADAPRQIGIVGPTHNLCVSPDGKSIAYIGQDNPDEFWGVHNDRVFLADVETGDARCLSANLDVTFGDVTNGESVGRGATGPFFEAETSLIVVATENGRCSLWRFPVNGQPGERIGPGDGESIPAISVAGGKTASLIARNDAGQIVVDDTIHTDFNRALFDEVDFPAPVSFVNPESGAECFALFPPGFIASATPRPTVVYIHGGPHLSYASAHLFHEYHALAAAGYVVLFPNPRGSKGYGESFTAAIENDWGAPAMLDVEWFVDEAIARGWTDAKKIGVLGGSYGGYLTAWLVGHTDRYACAIAERGVYNLVSMAGTSDFFWRDFGYFQANCTDKTDDYRRNSPLTYAGNVTTPTMLIHSEGDLRCPVSQADEYWQALCRAEKCESVYVRYGSEANHELSRGGPPDLRVDRQKRIHAWLDRFLKTDA